MPLSRTAKILVGVTLGYGVALGAVLAWQSLREDPAGLPRAAKAAIAARLASLGESYRPSVRHRGPDGKPLYTNRLILEHSPYLLRHAHHPVNWYPWGDEAFAEARRRNVPVFLSIGYSACHWCHVMESESFENEEIAAELNKSYVAVKVDREELPDVDETYARALTALGVPVGWPMTLWLNADRKAFFGGTYFPPWKGHRGQREGLLTLLPDLKAGFDADPARVAAAAQALAGTGEGLVPGLTLPDASLVRAAGEAYARRFDGNAGGVIEARKFPHSFPVPFLLAAFGEEPRFRKMGKLTLDRIAEGALRDHLGGGFHRYTIDTRWRLPHFEKMLSDQAQLTRAYLAGFVALGDERYAQLARETLRFVAREMTASEGGFYSALDAQADGREGAYYTWTPAEVRSALPPALARSFLAAYHVTERGPIEGRSPLWLAPGAKDNAAFAKAREILLDARSRRTRPFRDEKIVLGWNALMISAYAEAGLLLGEREYIARAEKAAAFALDKLKEKDGLLRVYAGGKARVAARLKDYTFFTAALLDLYQATGTPHWYEQAVATDAKVKGLFEDSERGGYFTTPAGDSSGLPRAKTDLDGAEPGGNSVAVRNLLRLYELSGDAAYRGRADRALRYFASRLSSEKAPMPYLLDALRLRLAKVKTVVVVAPQSQEQAGAFMAVLRKHYLRPQLVVAATEQEAAHGAPVARGKQAIGGKVTAYVCEGHVCQSPTSDLTEFERQLLAP